MSYGLRPFFARLGVALRGPDDPRAARRAAQEQARAELMRVIHRAAELESLTREPAWGRLQEEWTAAIAARLRTLRTSDAAGFSANQAALDAYEEAATIVARAMESARRARDELEGMSDA